jgi:hypothetical protein
MCASLKGVARANLVIVASLPVVDLPAAGDLAVAPYVAVALYVVAVAVAVAPYVAAAAVGPGADYVAAETEFYVAVGDAAAVDGLLSSARLPAAFVPSVDIESDLGFGG